MDTYEAAALARNLMREHGLMADGWHFQYDRAVKRFGVCNFSRKVIGLSEPLVRMNDEAHVKETILHEIAHALVGPGHNHDWTWQRQARLLGIKGTRCAPVTTVTPRGNVAAYCTTCEAVKHFFHRMPTRHYVCKTHRTRLVMRRVA